MRKASPRSRDLARRLLGRTAASASPIQTLSRSCGALRPRLMQLVGREGYRALLSRSLTLATGEVPWLAPVGLDANGTFERLEEALVGQEPGAAEAGGEIVLAHLLDLLVTFVGAEITGQLVHSSWPGVAADADFDREEGEA